MDIKMYTVINLAGSSQNYWVFGLCPSSGNLETLKYDISGTGSVWDSHTIKNQKETK
jgi:hypothetical protein